MSPHHPGALLWALARLAGLYRNQLPVQALSAGARAALSLAWATEVLTEMGGAAAGLRVDV
jgi:hypothetical protein